MDKSALVKLGTPARTGGYLGLGPNSKDVISSTRDLMGILIPAGRVIKVGGKGDGELITDKVIEAGQTVLISPLAELNPTRFQILLSYNPRLLKYGIISAPAVVQPGNSEDICLVFQAKKRIDLNDFDYLFSLYMID